MPILYQIPPLFFLQSFAKLVHGGLKRSTLCLTLELNKFLLSPCSSKDSSQRFELLENGLLYHRPSLKCVTSQATSSLPYLQDCDITNPSPDIALWEYRTSLSSWPISFCFFLFFLTNVSSPAYWYPNLMYHAGLHFKLCTAANGCGIWTYNLSLPKVAGSP
jgi:hypothetical protein